MGYTEIKMSASEKNKWKFVGGNLCLDFVNSIGGRVPQGKKYSSGYNIVNDKLKNFDDLIDWGKNSGAVIKPEAYELIKLKSKNQTEADIVFQRALELRESLFKIFGSIIEGAKPQEGNIKVLNREYSIAGENQFLVYHSNKLEWKFSSESAQLDNIIWKVVNSSAELLTSDLLNRVKICRGENCGWLFLDTTKNKSRQWCDMKDCGNLAKVRRFREKKKK